MGARERGSTTEANKKEENRTEEEESKRDRSRRRKKMANVVRASGGVARTMRPRSAVSGASARRVQRNNQVARRTQNQKPSGKRMNGRAICCTAKYGENNVHFDLDDLENTTG